MPTESFFNQFPFIDKILLIGIIFFYYCYTNIGKLKVKIISIKNHEVKISFVFKPFFNNHFKIFKVSYEIRNRFMYTTLSTSDRTLYEKELFSESNFTIKRDSPFKLEKTFEIPEEIIKDPLKNVSIRQVVTTGTPINSNQYIKIYSKTFLIPIVKRIKLELP